MAGITAPDIGMALYFLFSAVCAVSDARYLGVRREIFAAGAAAGAVCVFLSGRPPGTLALSFLPGLAALGLARLFPGALGSGDILYLLTAALFPEPGRYFAQLAAGFLLCGLRALAAASSAFIRGRRAGKKKLPLLVYLFAGAVLTEIIF
jgi:hypothetical protein